MDVLSLSWFEVARRLAFVRVWSFEDGKRGAVQKHRDDSQAPEGQRNPGRSR